jgi:glucokinase
METSEKVPCVLAMDLGGTLTKLGLVGRDGQILKSEVFSTGATGPFERFLERVGQVFSAWKAEGWFPEALGIGAPNASHQSGCMETPPNFKWGKRVPLLESLKEIWDLPAFLTNDANAAAIGELHFGVARNMKHFVTLTLGTGLGSGIISHGRLLTGSHGMAGEIGHINVYPDGRQCNCGLKGCLETYASVTGIRRTVLELIAEKGGGASALSKLSYEALEGRRISEAALEGDPVAREAFDFTGRILGIKMADTAAHLDPEAFVISGGLSKAGDLLLEPVRQSMESRLFSAYRGKIKVLLSRFSSEEAVLGPAALAWDSLEAS